MAMPGRSYSVVSGYRFGFNGKEKDNENMIIYENRVYDPRTARWLSPDPCEKVYPGLSTYHFSANNPINILDNDGCLLRDKNGNIIATSNGYTSESYQVGKFKTNPNQVINMPEVVVTSGKKKTEATQKDEVIDERVKINFEKITIYADDGTPIEALRMVSANYIKTIKKANGTIVTEESSAEQAGYDASSNCHGYSLASGQVWIIDKGTKRDGEVDKLLKGDGYKPGSLKDANIALISRTEDNSSEVVVQHTGIVQNGKFDAKDNADPIKKDMTKDEFKKDFVGPVFKHTISYYKRMRKDKKVSTSAGDVKRTPGFRFVTQEESTQIRKKNGLKTK